MSVGEPLNPEAVVWAEKALGLPFHDNWWQTETGSIMIANYPVLPIKPGSMGKPMPGIEPGIIDEQGNIKPPGEEGDLAVRPGWPSMFRTYWNNEPMYKSKFVNGWYITGDRARMDEDGYFWFVGRSDDVINTAGHLVGPVRGRERAHRAPRRRRGGRHRQAGPGGDGDRQGVRDAEGRLRAVRQAARRAAAVLAKKLGAGVAPREIDFIDVLPKTRSGKIMRRLLKARELGLPEGDTSTLEE